MPDAQDQLTHLLVAWRDGDASALEKLTPLIYAELRKLARFHMAREAPGHTLQPTALINEAYMKLADMHHPAWKDRKHFFAVASQIMRHLLVDYARKKRSNKRGREAIRVPFDEAIAVSAEISVDITALDEALTRLEHRPSGRLVVLDGELLHPRKERIEFRFHLSGLRIVHCDPRQLGDAPDCVFVHVHGCNYALAIIVLTLASNRAQSWQAHQVSMIKADLSELKTVLRPGQRLLGVDLGEKAIGVMLRETVRRLAPAATVILMTAFGSPDVRTDALKLGAVCVLDKPFDLEQLVGLVSRWSAA